MICDTCKHLKDHCGPDYYQGYDCHEGENMREIKFRAWDGGKMIFPELYGPDWDSCQTNGYQLMQYTGLKDKNGKEIYEGDIVNIGEKNTAEPCEVVFGDGCYCIKASWQNTPIGLWNYCNKMFIDCIEIIGNIYQNKGLLNT